MISMITRIQDLVTQLNQASLAYYQEDRQIMSDLEYDRLYDELKNLEEKTGFVLATSPTQKVGYEVVSQLTKATHPTPMLSLDKTKDPLALASFLGQEEGLLSWKLDGLTIVLSYQSGQLVEALTRGNGTVGENVTHNARVFKNVPLTVAEKAPFSIRGEAVISFKDFEAINAQEEVKYKNPRNLCSGAVRQLNSEVTAKRHVAFYAFGLVSSAQSSQADSTSKSQQLEWIKAQGFDIAHYDLVNQDTVAEKVQRFKEAVATYPLATDGLVLTYNDIAYSESLGATSKFPKDSMAFK